MENQSQLIKHTYGLAKDISNPVFSSSQEIDKLLSEYVKANPVSYYMMEPHKYRKDIASKLDKIKALHPKYDQAATSLKECLDLHPVLSIGIVTGNHGDTATAVFHDEVVELIGSITNSILVIESPGSKGILKKVVIHVTYLIIIIVGIKIDLRGTTNRKNNCVNRVLLQIGYNTVRNMDHININIYFQKKDETHKFY